jgi:hypothetical protein
LDSITQAIKGKIDEQTRVFKQATANGNLCSTYLYRNALQQEYGLTFGAYSCSTAPSPGIGHAYAGARDGVQEAVGTTEQQMVVGDAAQRELLSLERYVSFETINNDFTPAVKHAYGPGGKNQKKEEELVCDQSNDRQFVEVTEFIAKVAMVESFAKTYPKLQEISHRESVQTYQEPVKNKTLKNIIEETLVEDLGPAGNQPMQVIACGYAKIM